MRSIKIDHALVCAGILFSAAPSVYAADAEDNGLQEIVVTAQRFNSTVKTPRSASPQSPAISSTRRVLRTWRACLTKSRGLSMRSPAPVRPNTRREAWPRAGVVADRGILSGRRPADAAGSTSQTGKVVIDPNLYDIDRIELLRGPQGTLYGSGSMGGTVRVITSRRSSDFLEGSVQGTLSDTEGGSGNGGGSIMLNVPVGETLAVRFVATDKYRSGWIDRVVLNPFPRMYLFPHCRRTGAATFLRRPCRPWYTASTAESMDGFAGSILFKPDEDF